MKRQNIEVLLGFLDAIRRRDREAAAASWIPRSSGKASFPILFAATRVRWSASSWDSESSRSRSTVSS
jgi:hypothetical protein